MKKSSLLIVLVGVVGIIAAFLPWISGSAYGIDIQFTGMQVGAILNVIFYAIAIIVAVMPKFKEKAKKLTPLIVGILATLYTLYKLFGGGDTDGIKITYHFGAYLTLITSILMIALGAFSKKLDEKN